ncbi:hypothetical protein SCE1572_42525 [Sorangium cellulosum So0157-2]|uniref:Uncharacterized protein n=1 Tax=Sorangium cellulosum So0157-2 TaxID=1254432 RepID=S4YCQ7_SORCE|nr:hypothetical protein [Sorangium cellulosum]AGP40598.1 hypothetical protein SCE1572_42525 [Sorangium cellulosum So0157-2]
MRLEQGDVLGAVPAARAGARLAALVGGGRDLACAATSRSRSPGVLPCTFRRARRTARGFASTPIAARPASRASTRTVPLPQNGSSTRSPRLESASTSRRAVSGCIRAG